MDWFEISALNNGLWLLNPWTNVQITDHFLVARTV